MAGQLFLVLDGIQDGTVLSGRVQIDETFWPLPGAERERNADGSLKRGLSRSQLCIAAATDGRGRAAVEPCGLGKPSGPRVLAAYSRHIARGSVLVHDKEKSHRALVGELGLVSEAHDSRAVRRLPDRDNPLADVNRLHFLLKRFLAAHAGFDRADLKGWLDLFSVIAHPPSGMMEKAAMVMERAMARPGTLRFRDFYGGCRS